MPSQDVCLSVCPSVTRRYRVKVVIFYLFTPNVMAFSDWYKVKNALKTANFPNLICLQNGNKNNNNNNNK